MCAVLRFFGSPKRNLVQSLKINKIKIQNKAGKTTTRNPYKHNGQTDIISMFFYCEKNFFENILKMKKRRKSLIRDKLQHKIIC